MASISERQLGFLKRTDYRSGVYVDLLFSDGSGVVRSDWSDAFLTVGSIDGYLEPRSSARDPESRSRMALSRRALGNIHLLEGRLFPVNTVAPVRYAFPKRHKSMLPAFREFNHFAAFHTERLPVPLPVGMLFSDTRDRIQHNVVLTEYHGTDTLWSVIGVYGVLFERIFKTDEFVVAHARRQSAGINAALLRDHYYSFWTEDMLQLSDPDAKVMEDLRDFHQAYHASIADEIAAERALEKLFKRLKRTFRVTDEERRTILANAACTWRAFSDAGYILEDIASRQFVVKPDLETLLVDFESVKHVQRRLTRAEREAQFELFMKRSGPIPSEDALYLKKEYVA
ncbi:hypothetical protein HY493_04395 [Candidatus Woesearchaeota archaeon]|nr:hypothetical protein [Candidatus Woesearchaeota archaeon]